jgi:Fe-Mn family superoxide dismutase
MKQVDIWAEDLPRDRDVVVYCLYGFWVSEDTAAALRAKGIKASVLDGGISAWRAMGLPTEPL